MTAADAFMLSCAAIALLLIAGPIALAVIDAFIGDSRGGRP